MDGFNLVSSYLAKYRTALGRLLPSLNHGHQDSFTLPQNIASTDDYNHHNLFKSRLRL